MINEIRPGGTRWAEVVNKALNRENVPHAVWTITEDGFKQQVFFTFDELQALHTANSLDPLITYGRNGEILGLIVDARIPKALLDQGLLGRTQAEGIYVINHEGLENFTVYIGKTNNSDESVLQVFENGHPQL